MSISQLRNNTIRVSRVHFLYVAALAIQVIAYDAWKLITPEVVMQRWLATALLLVVTAVVWFIAKGKPLAGNTYRLLVAALVVADILIATFAVYSQRGMASRGIFLFAVPIIVSAVLLSRVALLATTAICIAAYTSAAISYFVLNFNEGYKIEMYGEVGFYSLGLILLAMLLIVVIRSKKGK